MRYAHAPFPKHAPHIAAALDRALTEKADGVLSAFRLLAPNAEGNCKAAGFVFGRPGFRMRPPFTPVSFNP